MTLAASGRVGGEKTNQVDLQHTTLWRLASAGPPDVTHLVVLAHGHAGRVLALALLARHPLAGEVRRGERPGGVGRRVLALLRRELTVGTVLLTTVTGLEEGGRTAKLQRATLKKMNSTK